MRTLRVADLEAKPGEKVSGFVHIIGAEFGIPVTLICGEKEGETVLISGGVHNAEYVGIQAAMQLADELDPKKIAGNIIVIRLMNRTGFEHRTMSLTYEDGKNLNRVFPGNPNGTLSDRIAYTVVTEFFPKADYYVDLHCGDGFEGLVSTGNTGKQRNYRGGKERKGSCGLGKVAADSHCRRQGDDGKVSLVVLACAPPSFSR